MPLRYAQLWYLPTSPRSPTPARAFPLRLAPLLSLQRAASKVAQPATVGTAETVETDVSTRLAERRAKVATPHVALPAFRLLNLPWRAAPSPQPLYRRYLPSLPAATAATVATVATAATAASTPPDAPPLSAGWRGEAVHSSIDSCYDGKRNKEKEKKFLRRTLQFT